MKPSALPQLMRMKNCVMASIGVVVGFVVVGGLEVNIGIILAAISAFLITGAGNTINDFYDKDADKRNAPHRPIPSGRASAKEASYLAVGLFGVGVVMAVFINYYCLILASINSIFLYIYGRYLKRMNFWGNLLTAFLAASTFYYGALVLNDLVIFNNLALALLFFMAFSANVGRELVGDIEDIEGDKKTGMTTLPIRIGTKKAWLWARVFTVIAIFLSIIPFLKGLFGVHYLGVVIVADAIFVWSLITSDARLNQVLTKVAIFIGLIAFVIGALL